MQVHHTGKIFFKAKCIRSSKWWSSNPEKRNLEQRYWVFTVLHCFISWIGKCVEISIHSIRKWWWSFCYSIHNCFIAGRKTDLLHGIIAWPVFIKRMHQGVWFITSNERWTWFFYLFQSKTSKSDLIFKVLVLDK